MRSRLWILAVLLLCLTGCGSEQANRPNMVHVVIENSENYSVFGNTAQVEPGSDVTFQILLRDNQKIQSVDYPDYTVEPAPVSSIGETNYQLLTLHDVRYSTVVSLTTYSPCRIAYYANGGQKTDDQAGDEPVIRHGNSGHLRPNTEQGTELFQRDGCTLTGWNTEPDGSGTAIGLGSRVDVETEIQLYAQWERWTDASSFRWEIRDGNAVITGGDGFGASLVIPAVLDGYPVTEIASGAFRQVDCKRVVLPNSIRCVQPLAFENAKLEDLYFFDTLTDMTDSSFVGCGNLTAIHINAARPPVYSGTYFDTFPDKMDRLMALRGQQKIVLFSGSSARFGYDSSRLDQAFPAYEIVNMGVYAYSNALPQYLSILNWMDAGDILLSAPEFDAISEQFCCTDRVGLEFFAMVEGNYDLLAGLDYQMFQGVLDDFRSFQEAREGMPDQSYELSAKNFDENHEPVTGFETYNEYGDYIYPRPNQSLDAAFGIKLADYAVSSYPEEVIQSLNRVYQRFLDEDVLVCFSYAPRSLRAVTEGSTKAERARLDVRLRERLFVPVISKIEDSLFSGNYFYETDNHLSDEGVQIRTGRIIDDLRVQMEHWE